MLQRLLLQRSDSTREGARAGPRNPASAGERARVLPPTLTNSQTLSTKTPIEDAGIIGEGDAVVLAVAGAGVSELTADGFVIVVAIGL